MTRHHMGIQLLFQEITSRFTACFFVFGPVGDVTGIGTVARVLATATLFVGPQGGRTLGIVAEEGMAHG